MKSEETIKKLFKKSNVNVGSQVDDRILGEAIDKLESVEQSARRSNIWRTIMKTKMTKFAAAAVIIIGVMLGLHMMGVPVDGASVAWAEVVEQINNYTKYKCRQRVVREQGPEYPTMDVYHINLSQRRQEVVNGDIHIIDMRGEDAITVELKPAEMKATVTKLIGIGPRKDPHIIEMVKRFEQESTERLGTKEVDGKILQGFRHVPNEYSDFTVWVDPETKLPVEIELVHTNRGQTLYLDEFEFDFKLDDSAFSTEVPDGYEVETLTQDYRPFEPKEIAAEDVRDELNHAAYRVEKLPWAEKMLTIKSLDPLGTRVKVYMTGIVSDDGNHLIIDQSNTTSDYKDAIMEWMLKEELVLESPSGVKLYTHPRGSDYAQIFLESFSKANSEFFDMNNLSEERFTRMVVMPDGTILGLSVNKEMSDEQLGELAESLVEIKAD